MGLQVAGLASGINWTQIIQQLIAADSGGINAVQTQQTTVNNKASALGGLNTDLTGLQTALTTLQDPSVTGGVQASSTTSGSTWSVGAANGTPTGYYAIAVSQLAAAAQSQGASNISKGLNATNDVSGLTLATMPAAQAVTAGTFTVNGHQITVATSNSLQDVFNAISTATGGTVTGSYDSTTDKVSLASSSGGLVLGAANDTSNFLQVLKLGNNGTSSVSSSSTLGSVKLNGPIASSNLASAITAVDGSGNGSLTINGVSVNYNVNTDSLNTVLGRISNSGAGVSAAYDANLNRIILTNSRTGDVGIGVSEASGGLLGALGLTAGASLVRGKNALYSVNGGPTQTNASNILDSTALGIKGLSVSVNSLSTQTIQVSSDTSALSTAIQGFISKFNAFQTDTAKDTTISTANGKTSTSVLSGNHDVDGWARSLQSAAFSAGSGASSVITSLDSLGIDFNGITGQLAVSDNAKLQAALAQNPSEVIKFFQSARTGFAASLNTTITNLSGQVTGMQKSMQSESASLGTQITTLQNQLDAEQTRLQAEFSAMETALAQMQTQSQSLASITGSASSSSSSSSSSSGIGTGSNKGTISTKP